MATRRVTTVTFTWEETPEMSYDSLIETLMHLGAEDIETDENDVEEPEYRPGGRKKPS